MTSAVTPGVFFLMVLAAGPPCQASQCPLPLPGKCSTSNYTIQDGTVCPAAKGDCNFTTAEGLCDYRQGCRDSVMTNWTVENGAVKANQRIAGSCSGVDFYYSVLESPWLEFTTESCLQFRYRRYVPAALDVFLALHNGSVLTVLDRNSNTGSGVLPTYNWTVQPGVGKVKFRAYGGGGTAPIEVRSVSVSPGDCGSSGSSSVNIELTTGNCRQLTSTTATTRRTLPMASTKNQDAFSQSTSPAATTTTTTLPTAPTSNQGTSSRTSDSQEDNGSQSNTAVVILAVVLCVVAAGLAVALVVIAMWRRKILYLMSQREAGTRELGPGFGHRETSASDVTDTPQNGGPASPCHYSSPGHLSPRSDYTSLRDIAPNTPAATEVPAAYYNVDNHQTTPCCNTEGILQDDDGRTSYYNLRGQGSAADVRARDPV